MGDGPSDSSFCDKPVIDGASRIRIERERQISEEGWTLEHDDDECEYEELAWAAVCYAAPSKVTADKITLVGQWDCNCRSVGECYCLTYGKEFENVRDPWPWDDSWDKRDKHDRIRQLTIAGALIAAEIDRLLRKED